MKRFQVFLYVMVLSFGLILEADATTITYTDFSDLSNFTLNGYTASINSSPVFYNGQDVLRLTNAGGQSGSAFLTNPISINNDYSFSTFFSFQITDNGGAEGGADGLTFVVQTNAANVGGGGGGIGYSGILNSMAVEYDTYNNGSHDLYNGNHVAIDLNGSLSPTSATQANVSTLLNDGNIWYTWIDYNGSTDSLEVRLSQLDQRPTSSLLNYTVDLAGVLGTPSAFIGFTSGTGAGWGDHDIRSWTFVDDYRPIDNPVPEPSTMLLLGLGLIGLAGATRKKLKK